MSTEVWIIFGVIGLVMGIAIFLALNMLGTETMGTIMIIVNDSENNPAQAAKVTLKSPNGEIISTGMTGEDGSIIFTGIVLNKSYIVIAESAEGFASEKILPRSDGDTFLLKLQKGGSEGSGESDRPNL